MSAKVKKQDLTMDKKKATLASGHIESSPAIRINREVGNGKEPEGSYKSYIIPGIPPPIPAIAAAEFGSSG
ncbi:MAG: hypothetical protein RIS20_1747 [Bacteroidota bacterium]|jgi:hypothetical protein